MDRKSGYSQTLNSVEQETWNFYYGLNGMEKATRSQNSSVNLTIDYTVDVNGRMTSATYDEDW